MAEKPQGDNVYERAKNALSKNGVDTPSLDAEIRAGKYLQKLQRNESIDRNDDTREAQRTLLRSLEGGVVTNYSDKTTPIKGGWDFGDGLKYQDYKGNPSENAQNGFYKRDAGTGDIIETVVRHYDDRVTSGKTTIGSSEGIDASRSSNWQFGMVQNTNGTITDGEWNKATGKLINGTIVTPDKKIIAVTNNTDTRNISPTSTVATNTSISEPRKAIQNPIDTLKDKFAKTIFQIDGKPVPGLDTSKLEITPTPDGKYTIDSKISGFSVLGNILKEPIIIDTDGKLVTKEVIIEKSIALRFASFLMNNDQKAILDSLKNGEKFTLFQDVASNTLKIEKKRT